MRLACSTSSSLDIKAIALKQVVQWLAPVIMGNSNGGRLLDSTLCSHLCTGVFVGKGGGSDGLAANGVVHGGSVVWCVSASKWNRLVVAGRGGGMVNEWHGIGRQ